MKVLLKKLPWIDKETQKIVFAFCYYFNPCGNRNSKRNLFLFANSVAGVSLSAMARSVGDSNIFDLCCNSILEKIDCF